MILRDIAESDYHYDAETVGGWTLYQYKQYVCEKNLLKSTVTFGTLAEAIAYRDQRRVENDRARLREFSCVKDDNE